MKICKIRIRRQEEEGPPLYKKKKDHHEKTTKRRPRPQKPPLPIFTNTTIFVSLTKRKKIFNKVGPAVGYLFSGSSNSQTSRKSSPASKPAGTLPDTPPPPPSSYFSSFSQTPSSPSILESSLLFHHRRNLTNYGSNQPVLGRSPVSS